MEAETEVAESDWTTTRGGGGGLIKGIGLHKNLVCLSN